MMLTDTNAEDWTTETFMEPIK